MKGPKDLLGYCEIDPSAKDPHFGGIGKGD